MLVEEITHYLHDDPKNLKSNITRAARLWQQSGLDEERFFSLLYEARSKAMAQTKVKKESTVGKGYKNRMPLYFAAIEQLIGLRDEQGRPVSGRQA